MTEIDHRKVYAKGYYDGLNAREAMTPQKLDQKLEGQTIIARKVFDAVPIEGPWNANQVAQEVKRATGTNPDPHTLRGCLNSLKSAGLVRECSPGHWQRVHTHSRDRSPAAELKEVKKLMVVPKPESAPPKLPEAGKNGNSGNIDAIGKLSAIAVAARNIGRSCNELATEIEDTALAIQGGIEANEGNLEKLKQLQSLLKSLGS